MEGYDLVIAGNEASNGRTGAVPAMVADVLGLPALTHGGEKVEDEGDGGSKIAAYLVGQKSIWFASPKEERRT